MMRLRLCSSAPRPMRGASCRWTEDAREALDSAWPTATGAGSSIWPRTCSLPGLQTPRRRSTARRLGELVQRRAPIYDKGQDGHYNLISALHKSVRGSDPDAALYWLARMLAGGEDPLYIARRLVRMAVEDIGLADPAALVQANAAKDAYDFLGSSGRRAGAGASHRLSRHRAEIECRPIWPSKPRPARGEGGRFAAAAQAHSQRADHADEAGGLWPRLRLRSQRGRRRSRARTISRTAWSGSISTRRQTVASSATSRSGSTAGPRSGPRKGEGA